MEFQIKTIQKQLRDFLYLPLHISTKDKTTFFRILTSLLFSGIPLVKALKITKNKIKNEQLMEIVDELYKHVEIGDPLSRGMRKYPKVFDQKEIGLIEAGEKTGTINESLQRVTTDLEKYAELRSKVLSSLLYPFIIIGLLFVVLLIIVTFVIPTLVSIFESQDAPIPFALNAIQATLSFLSSYYLLIIVLALLAAFGARKYFAKSKNKFKLHSFLLKIPVYGDIIRRSALITITQTFATLLEAGLPITKASDLLIQTQKLLPYKYALEHMKQRVIDGHSISESLPSDPTLFPDDIKELISIGESSASMQDMFQKIAKQYTFELEYKLKNLSTIIEPAALVFVAILIGIFAFTVLGSIFDLISTFSV